MFRFLPLLLTAWLAVAAGANLPAEKPYAGIVSKVTQRTCEGCKHVEVSIVLKTSKGKLEIKLGPKPFLEEHGLLPAVGDDVTVVGITLPDNGKQTVFANEIGKGGTHLVLRGDSGRPEWLDK